MSKNQKIILVAIIALAAFLIFFRLTRHDMLGDDAHYAFRSIGYFDYMASEEQTAPAQWFGYRPWWSYLSFHDHPPLVFLIQFMFFKLFGISVFAARLPAALAAVGSIIISFFIGRRLADTSAGLLAAGALTLNNYLIWTGRLGLLESVFTFFLLCAIWYLLKALENDKYFLHAGIFFGLTGLAKYTLLLFLPALAIYFLWKRRDCLRNKKFWFGVAMFLIISGPILIYNFMMFEGRGHFDVQFSDLFNQQHQDWTRLSPRVGESGFYPLNTVSALASGFSWPYFAVFSLSFVWLGILAIKKKIDERVWILWLMFMLLFTGFSFMGAAPRWLGVTAPFAALFVGISGARLFKRKLIQLAAAGLAVFCLAFVLNTNTLARARGSQFWHSPLRFENYGYRQLDQKISQMLAKSFVPEDVRNVVTAWWYKDIQQAIDFPPSRPGDKEFSSIIVYDLNTNWFPTLWIFERQKFYHQVLVATSEEFFKILRSSDVEILNSLQTDGIYYIHAGPEVSATSGINFAESSILVDNFKAQNIVPEIVYDDQGREAFYIYHGSFK